MSESQPICIIAVNDGKFEFRQIHDNEWMPWRCYRNGALWEQFPETNNRETALLVELKRTRAPPEPKNVQLQWTQVSEVTAGRWPRWRADISNGTWLGVEQDPDTQKFSFIVFSSDRGGTLATNNKPIDTLVDAQWHAEYKARHLGLIGPAT